MELTDEFTYRFTKQTMNRWGYPSVHNQNI